MESSYIYLNVIKAIHMRGYLYVQFRIVLCCVTVLQTGHIISIKVTRSIRRCTSTVPPAHEAEHSDHDVCCHTNSVTLMTVSFGVVIVYV